MCSRHSWIGLVVLILLEWTVCQEPRDPICSFLPQKKNSAVMYVSHALQQTKAMVSEKKKLSTSMCLDLAVLIFPEHVARILLLWFYFSSDLWSRLVVFIYSLLSCNSDNVLTGFTQHLGYSKSLVKLWQSCNLHFVGDFKSFFRWFLCFYSFTHFYSSLGAWTNCWSISPWWM